MGRGKLEGATQTNSIYFQNPFQMKNLVSAELMDGITFTMLEDRLVHIVSDNAVFLVTTRENAHNYPTLDFYNVPDEALEAYDISLEQFNCS